MLGEMEGIFSVLVVPVKMSQPAWKEEEYQATLHLEGLGSTG